MNRQTIPVFLLRLTALVTSAVARCQRVGGAPFSPEPEVTAKRRVGLHRFVQTALAHLTRIRPGLRILALVMFPIPALAQPVITNQPRTQFQWENRFVTLNVAATATAPTTYQWQFNGGAIRDATNRTYRMSRVQLTNDGSYRVVVTDPTGTATSTVARVMVRAWPKPTGPFVSELARLDTNMMNIMLANNVPGGSLAVVKDGRLVLARGYGFADVENREPFQPDSLCRGASLSKTITAATAMKLVEDGRVDLDAPVLPILRLEQPDYPGSAFDSRWTNVTLRHCLNHTGGWNRDIAIDPLGATGFDPVYWPDQVAKDLKLREAPAPVDVVRWMLGKPLQTRPGSEFAYSNLGYQIVGAVIEGIRRTSYEEVAQAFLSEAGIRRMHVGEDARSDRRPGEAVYYLHPSITADWARVTVEPKPFDFELPYAFPVSLRAAVGGWLISTIDYARFVASIDGDPSYPDILGTNAIATMVARPKVPGTSADDYIGLGWDSVNPRSSVWLKTGAGDGWRSFSAKYRRGMIFILTMNTYWTALDSFGLWSTFSPLLDGIRQWPAHDLFPNTLSYEAWETKHLGDRGAMALGYESDPDRDGVPNLVEYSQGTDPLVASARPPLTVAVERTDGQITVAIGYRRLLLAHEIDYSLQASDDLASWSPVSGETSEPLLNSDGTVTVQTKIASPEPDAVRFFRLVVARKKA